MKMNKTTIALIVIAIAAIIFAYSTHAKLTDSEYDQVKSQQYIDSLEVNNASLLLSNEMIALENDSLSMVVDLNMLIIKRDSLVILKKNRTITKLKNKKNEISNYVNSLDNLDILSELSRAID